MQIGAIFPQTEIGADPVAIRDYAQAVEELGYAHLVAYDHVLGANTETPERRGRRWPYTFQHQFHEPLVLFGYLAAITRRIGLVTGILILPQRQTALVAKQAAEVDVLSSGRLRLGVGLGWNEVEYEALGENFHNRGRRIEEQVTVLRALWTQPLVTFHGRWHHITDAGINPLPVQRPIPIWMGGTDERVLRRIARMADGGYRDALTLLEQAMLSEGETITLQGVYDQLGLVSEEAVDALLNAIRAADAADLARRLDEIAAQGRDPRAIVESMLHRLTDLTRAGFGVSEGGDATREASLHETAARFGRENLLALRSELAATHQAIRDISLPRLWLEAELARIALKLSPKTPSDVPPLPTPVEPVVATPRPSNFGRQLPPVAPADEVVSQTAAPPAEPLSPQEVLDATREAMDSRMVMKRKLEGATVDSCDNGILVLRFDLALTAAWFKEDAKRRKFLLGELERHGLNVRAIECVAEARTSQGAEPESVELPLQGSDLHRAIKQVMSAPDDNTTP
ncbi:MAG: hypothetical protein C4289_05905 [Chloroflexota bacterium]